MTGPRTRIVTFGNCQAEGLKRLLDRSLPAGYQIEFYSNNSRTGGMRPESDILTAIGEADVVCFQPLNAKHGVLSGANIRATITGAGFDFPYLFNAGISGLAQGVGRQRLISPGAIDGRSAGSTGLGMRDHGLVYGEEAILNRLGDGDPLNTIVEDYERGAIDFRLRERFGRSLAELSRRETKLDIKLADFVKANHTRERLFLMPRHPSTALMLELADQFGRLAGLPLDLDPVRDLNDADAAGLGRGISPISPADAEAMGYEFSPDPNWQVQGTRLINLIARKFKLSRERGHKVEGRLDPADIHVGARPAPGQVA